MRRHSSTGAESHVPEGAVCIDDDTFRFADGTRLRQFEIPASASHVDPGVRAYSFAPDGSIWIIVVGKRHPDEFGCELEPLHSEGFSDGLFLITSEAVTATE